jgi:hypothetical protein
MKNRQLKTGNWKLPPAILFVAVFLSPLFSAPPSDLPGEELTERQINEARRRRGGNQAARTLDTTAVASVVSTERLWFDKAMDTWNAPRLSVQQSADEVIIPFGKGGIFIPKFTEMNIEPDVEVFDMSDNRIVSSETGRTILLEPGEYRVMVGSGSMRQRIVKNVNVVEGQTRPIIPDWSVLVIDVVDEHGMTLKGEYELVRIDEFDPYGRGYGASIELGETVRAWVLRPGLYKILGVGEGYNTLTNFVTVRLMPGEFTSFLLIQEPQKFSIRGGGTIHLTPSTKLASNWSVGLNFGANIQLNTETDHQTDIETSTFTTGLLLDAWLLYRKKPMEWSTKLRFEEGINIIDNSFDDMINTPDRMILSSIYIWRLLNWLGPYGSAEFNTKFFETRVRRSTENWFCFVDSSYVFNEAAGFDSSQTLVIEPALSPLIFEVGVGVSADFTSWRYFELRSRLGFGSSYSKYGDRHRIIENDKVEYTSPDSLAHKASVARSIVLFPEDKIDIFEVGPQAAISAMVRLGGVASAEGELKLFAPVLPEARLTRPDFEFNGTLSWRLSRILNLDYTYRQMLKQPTELNVPVHTSSHGIWLRLHYSSR